MLLSLEHLSSDALRTAAADALLVVPLGATEQHGRHLPTGTDTMLVTAVAERAARQARATVVLAPSLPIGSSDHHVGIGPTLSVSWETLARMLQDVLTSAVASGFSRIMLLNGHGGNDAVVHEVATERSRVLGVEVARACYWDFLDASDRMPHTPGHAGAFEASLMLVVAPELVRLDRAEAPLRDPDELFGGPPWVERRSNWVELGGVSDDATAATEAQGRALLDRVVLRLAAAFDTLAGPSAAAGPA